MEHSLLQQFINALRCIPGVGPKSAQRTAYYLLERDRESALNLATLMQQALERIKHCQNCRMLTENGRSNRWDGFARGNKIPVLKCPKHFRVTS